MKYAFAAIALAAIAQAQTLADVPECAIPCLDKSIKDNTSCETTDLACVCENFDKVQGDATSCVVEKCGAEVALNEVLPAAQKLCENPPASGGSSSAASEPPATSAAAATTTAVEAPSSEYPVESSSSEYPVETTTAVVVTPEPLPTPEETTTVVVPPSETEAEPTPVPTAGAATLGSMGALAMVVLGAIAL